MAPPADMETLATGDETKTESDQLSRLKRYDQRVEEWLTSLKDEAGQRSPEVLSALAAKAKDVAEYLDKMAEKAKSKNEASEVNSTADEPSPGDESTVASGRDPGSSIT